MMREPNVKWTNSNNENEGKINVGKKNRNEICTIN